MYNQRKKTDLPPSLVLFVLGLGRYVRPQTKVIVPGTGTKGRDQCDSSAGLYSVGTRRDGGRKNYTRLLSQDLNHRIRRDFWLVVCSSTHRLSTGLPSTRGLS